MSNFSSESVECENSNINVVDDLYTLADLFIIHCLGKVRAEMNNGEISGPRGRGRGWQQSENQPRELRRPRIVTEDSKGKLYWNISLIYFTLSNTELGVMTSY